MADEYTHLEGGKKIPLDPLDFDFYDALYKSDAKAVGDILSRHPEKKALLEQEIYLDTPLETKQYLTGWRLISKSNEPVAFAVNVVEAIKDRGIDIPMDFVNGLSSKSGLRVACFNANLISKDMLQQSHAYALIGKIGVNNLLTEFMECGFAPPSKDSLGKCYFGRMMRDTDVDNVGASVLPHLDMYLKDSDAPKNIQEMMCVIDDYFTDSENDPSATNQLISVVRHCRWLAFLEQAGYPVQEWIKEHQCNHLDTMQRHEIFDFDSISSAIAVGMKPQTPEQQAMVDAHCLTEDRVVAAVAALKDENYAMQLVLASGDADQEIQVREHKVSRLDHLIAIGQESFAAKIATMQTANAARGALDDILGRRPSP